MSEVSVVRQEPLRLNRFTTETVKRGGVTYINHPEGVVAAWEPPPGFDPQAHAQQHNLSNIGYETKTDAITGESRSTAYTKMTHEEYEALRQSPQGIKHELPALTPEQPGNNLGTVVFKGAPSPVRAKVANPPEIPPEDVENPEAPEGERTSKKLDDLKAQREANNKNLINTDTADEYVRFDDLHGSLNELISEIKGEPGTIGDYVAQRDRAAIGFAKDALLSVGELAYEGSKLIVDAQQAMLTPAGMQGKILDAQIYLEEIRLGNVTPSTMGSGAISTVTNVGKAMVSPITKPWAEGQYVEAVTRGLLEAITLPLVALKSGKIAKGGNALKDGTTANKTANTTGDKNKITTANEVAKAPKSKGPNGDGGKVEKKSAIGKSLAEERAHVKKLSDEAAEAEKNGDLRLRDAKLEEARGFLKERVLDNQDIPNANKPQALIDRLDVSSQKDKAVFWSGNPDAAKNLAKEIDGVCLETTNGGRIIDGWPELKRSFPGWKGDASPNEFELWGGVSEKYAMGVTGDVRVIQTAERAASGGGLVWKSSEKSILETNLEEKIITKIEYIVIP